MSLWVDKYRPANLNKLDYHNELTEQLKALASCGDFPHLLIYGPPGAGKKTRIMCLLREIYGAGVERMRIENHVYQTPSNRKVDITTRDSNYHVEVNPSDVGIHDRVVIQELIKSLAEVQQFDSSTQKEFKVVVISEVDKVTKDAQHALRRTMEKYMKTCRIILCCNSISKVIPAIRSRCLGIRIPAPSQEEILKVLNYVCKKEGVNLPSELGKRIAENCDRNLRRALLMCETCRVQKYPMSSDQHIQEPDWKIYLTTTANQILEEQSPKRLQEVRLRLYELLCHCIPPKIIFQVLVKELVKNIDVQLRYEVVAAAAYYEHRLNLGSKPIFHLEAFIAKFMAMYKRFLEDSVAEFF